MEMGMSDDIRELMERWARWRHFRYGGYGKTLTDKFIEGMPGTNCKACGGAGRMPVGRHGNAQQFIICEECGGTGRVKLDDKATISRVLPCPAECGPRDDRRDEKYGEINGKTCIRCRGAGTVTISHVKVNPAFIRSTYIEPCDPVGERIDRLVCELRQRPKTQSYYLVIWYEYCDARGGTHETKARRIFLTCSAFEKRLERGMEWIMAARTDVRSINLIPFPYKSEPINKVVSLPYRLDKITA
jgi:hypothetical protein